jgi:hypothetical protein
MELKDHYSLWNIEDKVYELFEGYEDGNEDEDSVNDTMKTLAYWYYHQYLFKLNRRKINYQLQQHFKEKREKKTQ